MPTRTSRTPHRRLGPWGGLVRCEPPERAWVIRRLWFEWREDPWCHRPALLGLPLLALATMSLLIPPHTVPVPELIAGICGFLAGCCLLFGLLAARRVARRELPELLLRLDRCACCGHGSARRGEKEVGATPRSCRDWTCSECGTFWPGTTTSIPEFEFRRAA